MELVSDGDSGAFEVVFERHAAAAFSLAYRMCGARARAEDVVQDGFLTLWRSGVRYQRTRGSVRSWILSLVHNQAIDVLRRDLARDARDMRHEHLSERLRTAELTEDRAEQREDAQRVRTALGDLPADQRQVIELAYFGGFTHTEISEMLELPAGTVKGRMRLGLTKLRLSLGAGEIAG